MTLIYIILIILGFLPFCIVLYKVKRIQRLKREGIKTTGIVRAISGTPSSKLSSIIIDYYIVEKNEWVRKKIITAGMPYSEGQELPVYYDPADPDKMIPEPGKGYIAMIIFTLLIAALIIAACFFINRDLQNTEQGTRNVESRTS